MIGLQQIKSHLSNCMDVLGEVLQSGFIAVSEDTLNKLKFLSQGSGQRGLSQLETYLNELYEALSGMKHQMKRDKESEKNSNINAARSKKRRKTMSQKSI